jgi:hypothetical protein
VTFKLAMLKSIIENSDIAAKTKGLKTGNEAFPANNNGHIRKPAGDHKGFIASFSPGSQEFLTIRNKAPSFFPSAPVTTTDKAGTPALISQKRKKENGQGSFSGAAKRDISEANGQKGWFKTGP